MTHSQHTYYLASNRRVYGKHANDLDIVALLYATYMRHVGGVVGRYGGASIFDPKIDFIRVIFCDKYGSFEVLDVPR